MRRRVIGSAIVIAVLGVLWYLIPATPIAPSVDQTAALESTAPDGTMLWYLSTATAGFGEVQRRFFMDHPRFTCEYQGALTQNGYTQGHWLKCRNNEAKP